MPAGRAGGRHLLRLRNTVKADARNRLITILTLTDAAARDIRSLDAVLRDGDGTVLCEQVCAGFADHVTRQGVKAEACSRRVRGQGELTEQQLSENRRSPESACASSISSIFMEMSMRGLTVRSIGIGRATFSIGLTNLAYNLCRAAFLLRQSGRAL